MRILLQALFVCALIVWGPDTSAQERPAVSDTGASPRSGLSNPTPRPAQEAFSETVFGVPIDDPYRWMEDPAREQEMVKWVRSASDHTVSELAALPGRKRLGERLQALSRASASHSKLVFAGGRTFF